MNKLKETCFFFKILCLVSVSDLGIPESEAYSILSEQNEGLDNLQWAQISIALKPFLIYSNWDNVQLISFVHHHLKKVK